METFKLVNFFSKENEAPPPPAFVKPESTSAAKLLPKALEKVASANKSSYDITPAKIFLPSTENNYNVDDLSSNDSTDDEEHPRKVIPQWARSKQSFESVCGNSQLSSLGTHLYKHVKEIEKAMSSDERARHFGNVKPPNIYEVRLFTKLLLSEFQLFSCSRPRRPTRRALRRRSGPRRCRTQRPDIAAYSKWSRMRTGRNESI